VIQLQISSLHVTGHVRLGNVWLAIVMICTTPNVSSCQVTAKNHKLFESEQSCKVEAKTVADLVASKGAYSKWGCFKIGEEA
jgi:hypothetical protein